MTKKGKAVIGVGVAVLAIFVIGYLALGPIGRLFVRDPVDVFGYGVQTVAKGAENGASAVQDTITKQTTTPEKANTAKLVTSSHPETTKWNVPVISETFTMLPQEKRTYSLTTEEATEAYLTGKIVTNANYSPLLLKIDNGHCKEIMFGCPVQAAGHGNFGTNASDVNLKLFTGTTQQVIIENSTTKPVTVNVNVGIDYTRTVQVSGGQ